MTNWAIVVGINQYEHLPPQDHLNYAVSDAERVKQFLCKNAGFQEDFVILCSDTSEPVSGLNTRPDSVNLRKILRKLSEHPNAQHSEQAWFFFSGHGLLGKDNQNYLLTSNSDPEDLEHSAISVEFVIQQLIRCQARNMVLVLDMCRNEAPNGSKGSSGFNEAQLEQQAQQNGIITIFSCSRGGKSYELPDLQQGAFTHAFLAGLQQHTILRQLDSYLQAKVHALTRTKQPPQIPLIVPEPGWKYDLPLLPHCATKTDLDTLKSQAVHAWISEKNLNLATQLWELVNDLATDPQDKKLSREALVKIAQEQQGLRPNETPQAVEKTLTFHLPTTIQGLRPNETPQTVEKTLTFHLPAKPTPPQPDDDLRSEKGIDYTKLRDLLKAQKWKDADRETYEVMIRAVGKKSGEWFTEDQLLNFPCADLKTIDRLWVKYSNGRFGFSVQKKIYVECGGTLDGKDPGDETWEKFGDRVGWHKDGDWLDYDDLNPSLPSPQGMLPWDASFGPVERPVSWSGRFVWMGYPRKSRVWVVSFLAQRLVNCSTSQS